MSVDATYNYGNNFEFSYPYEDNIPKEMNVEEGDDDSDTDQCTLLNTVETQTQSIELSLVPPLYQPLSHMLSIKLNAMHVVEFPKYPHMLLAHMICFDAHPRDLCVGLQFLKKKTVL